jgi:hypothetical protein
MRNQTENNKKTWQEPAIETIDIDSLNPLAPLMDIDQINS